MFVHKIKWIHGYTWIKDGHMIIITQILRKMVEESRNPILDAIWFTKSVTTFPWLANHPYIHVDGWMVGDKKVDFCSVMHKNNWNQECLKNNKHFSNEWMDEETERRK